MEYARSTGNSTLIKSEKLKDFIARFKDTNSTLQAIMTEFPAGSVTPDEPEFYDWTVPQAEEPAPAETASEETPNEEQTEQEESAETPAEEEAKPTEESEADTPKDENK